MVASAVLDGMDTVMDAVVGTILGAGRSCTVPVVTDNVLNTLSGSKLPVALFNLGLEKVCRSLNLPLTCRSGPGSIWMSGISSVESEIR